MLGAEVTPGEEVPLLEAGRAPDELLAVRRAVLDALALLETLKRTPDGEHGNGGHDVERFAIAMQDVTERLQEAARVLARRIAEQRACAR